METCERCPRPIHAKGRCRVHYESSRACSIPGCDRPHYGLGWCRKHWKANRKFGSPTIYRGPAAATAGDWTPETIAWAAGLLEGEGGFMVSRRTGRLPELRLTCGSTDYDVLERLPAIFGAGRISGPIAPRPDGLRKKTAWEWRVTRVNHVVGICWAIMPHMGSRRREQIRRIVLAYEERGPVKVYAAA